MSASAGRIIRAVVFDLDDTLYPERDYVRSGYRAVASLLGATGRCPSGSADECFNWLWARFLAGSSQGAFNALSEQFRLDLSAGDLNELVRVYREHVPDIRAYDGVAGLLSTLHPEFKLGVLSDGYLPAQQLKFAALGLERFFDAVVFTEQMGRDAWKPSPRGFLRAAEMLGLAGEACCYVADNPAKDFLGANGLGWLTVQYRRVGQVHADRPAPPGGLPRAVVHAPDELLTAIRRWRCIDSPPGPR